MTRYDNCYNLNDYFTDFILNIDVIERARVYVCVCLSVSVRARPRACV